MKIDIQNRFSGEVLFSHDAKENTINLTVKAAISCGANLFGANLSKALLPRADLSKADLSGANLSRSNLAGAQLSKTNLSRANLSRALMSRASLSGANLVEAKLPGANLYEANLTGANLSRANLSGANLSGADLTRADLFKVELTGANLYRANLSEAYLFREENIVSEIKQFGNFGSRGGYTVAFRLEKSIEINCGCFWGNIEQFTEKVKTTHVGNKYEKEYMAVINLLKEIWGV